MTSPSPPSLSCAGAERLPDGYRLLRSAPLETLRALYCELEHEPTGARHIHIACHDRENVAGVTFKTVPTDSTGVAHILEHTVLCGSRRYPVRDPFFSMLKRSLSTFMNAFTASDWTMYPFATQNRRDFYNLLDVYLDSAFHPRLERLSFCQEGHRLDLAESASGAMPGLVYKGVVYNEMKGAMSSPDQVMGRSLLSALLPDTTYRHNSGGEPAEIPRLTHEALLAFHRRHYHPSNAFFFTYGDLPLAEHLASIQQGFLRHFERIDPQTEVHSQPRWSEPRRFSQPYPIDPAEQGQRKHQACLAWLTADIRDAFEILALRVLEHVLLGNAASPLRKALIDTGLGSTLSDGSGFDGDCKDTLFTCGLKDVGAADAEPIAKLILDLLTDLAERGIDRELVANALHQIEFQRREVTNHPYPHGLKLLLGITGSWIHGGDPLAILQFEPDLERLRREALEGRLLEERIRRFLLDNPHRVLFTLVPDTQLAAQENARVARELEQRAQSLSPADIAQLRAQSQRLQALQEEREDPAVLPTLALSEIAPEIEPVQALAPIDRWPYLTRYEMPTAGICYLSTAIGCGQLPPAQLPLVPFFCHAMSRMGTRQRSYVELARRIDAVTGGLSVLPQTRSYIHGPGQCLPFLVLGAKCLARHRAPMLGIVSELLHEVSFSDRERLRNLLLEYRAGLEAAVVPNGHRLAMLLAARHISTTAALAEVWGGIHQLQTIKSLCTDLSATALTTLAESLQAIAAELFRRENLRAALIGEAAELDPSAQQFADLAAALPAGGQQGFTEPALERLASPAHEGWSTATAVSFVAAAMPVARTTDEAAPALAVIAKLLRSLFLHREIREKGGAYGGFASYNAEDGLFSFGSYRDPRIVETLEIYRQAAEFIRTGDYGQEDIKEAVLQVCSEIDKPHAPGQAARNAFYRQLVGLSDEDRQRFKSGVLTIDRQAVVKAAERYFMPQGNDWGIAVISSPELLQSANTRLDRRPLTLTRI